MEQNYSDFYSQIEQLVSKKTMAKPAFHFSLKAAPKRSFSISKKDGKIQVTLDELRPLEDRVGSITYAALGANKSADKLVVIYTVSDNQLIPVFAQLGVLAPLHQGTDAESMRQLAAFGTIVSNELRYGNYLDLIKKGPGIFYVVLANLNLKDVRYDRGDIVPEVEYKKLNAHYQSKFVQTVVSISDKLPEKMTELGTPLSTKTGFLCRANISTADDIKFKRGEVYSEEQMKSCPSDKKHKFTIVGRPNVTPEIPA
jgi:hypothetical protein